MRKFSFVIFAVTSTFFLSHFLFLFLSTLKYQFQLIQIRAQASVVLSSLSSVQVSAQVSAQKALKSRLLKERGIRKGIQKGIQGKKIIRVILDPGHGGRDRGAVSGDLDEASLNLKVAFFLSRFLKKDPYFNVSLTRSSDFFLSLEERTKMAHKKGEIFF